MVFAELVSVLVWCIGTKLVELGINKIREKIKEKKKQKPKREAESKSQQECERCKKIVSKEMKAAKEKMEQGKEAFKDWVGKFLERFKSQSKLPKMDYGVTEQVWELEDAWADAQGNFTLWKHDWIHVTPTINLEEEEKTNATNNEGVPQIIGRQKGPINTPLERRYQCDQENRAPLVVCESLIDYVAPRKSGQLAELTPRRYCLENNNGKCCIGWELASAQRELSDYFQPMGALRVVMERCRYRTELVAGWGSVHVPNTGIFAHEYLHRG